MNEKALHLLLYIQDSEEHSICFVLEFLKFVLKKISLNILLLMY